MSRTKLLSPTTLGVASLILTATLWLTAYWPDKADRALRSIPLFYPLVWFYVWLAAPVVLALAAVRGSWWWLIAAGAAVVTAAIFGIGVLA